MAEAIVTWGTRSARLLGILFVLALPMACSHQVEQPNRPGRLVTAEIVPSGTDASAYSLVMTVRQGDGAIIDQAKVDGLRLDDRRAVNITPRQCRPYRYSIENGQYVSKTLCTGITLRGVLWGYGRSLNFSIEQAEFSELLAMNTFKPFTNSDMAVEQPSVRKMAAFGSIITFPQTGGVKDLEMYSSGN